MEKATLDDFMALNDQLAALAAAGVPLDVGLGSSGKDTAAVLEKVNNAVARRVSQGASLSEALEVDDPAVPSAYRGLMQLGVQSGNLYAPLDGSSRVADTVNESWYAVRSSLTYPLIVGCLAYIGMIGFCLFFVPTMSNMQQSMGLQRGFGLGILEGLRDSLPYWVPIPPVLLLLFLVWQLRGAPSRGLSSGRSASALAWIPGMSRALFQQRSANFANTVANLLDEGMPLAEALPLAAAACGDVHLNQGGRSLAAALNDGHVPDDDSATARQFPPFLRWALWHSEATTGRARALHMAARIYRESAQRHIDRLRIVAPIATCVVLGGGITLLYGLALFVPVVEMLQGLS